MPRRRGAEHSRHAAATMTPLLLLLPLLVLVGAAPELPREVQEIITIDTGLDEGSWGDVEFCPGGSKVFGFELKYEPTGNLDDTAVNAIRLYCRDAVGSLTGDIISAEGSQGAWLDLRTCPGSETVTGFQANVVPYMGTIGDDLGVDNLRLQCSGGDILDGLYGTPIPDKDEEAEHGKPTASGHTRDLGEWSSWATCSEGLDVCGFQVRLEDGHTFSDDAGIVDLVMYCCDST